MYERAQVKTIENRILEKNNPLIQAVVGPRQTGKSTMIVQALKNTGVKNLFVSADDVLSHDENWLRTEWQQASLLNKKTDENFIFVIDEIQKVANWPNILKGLWDATQREEKPMRVIISGSSSLLLRKGLEDSLKGRFEVIRSPHWSYAECADAFGFSLDDFLYYGGFPGAARFIHDNNRWQAYMRDSILEPTIAYDVLSNEEVRKPALLRALFELGARYSAQELSYNKMLGQLTDAGNTTTLAHYLELLSKADVLCSIEKYHPKELVARKSSPRFMVYDTALMTSVAHRNKDLLLSDSELRGHLVESAVGAFLLARAKEEGFKLYWWRDGAHEVDFVVDAGETLIAIEVKSGRMKSQNGMNAFLQQYPQAIRMIIGGNASGSVSIEDFLSGKVALPL